jgi:hypothetical protein
MMEGNVSDEMTLHAFLAKIEGTYDQAQRV